MKTIFLLIALALGFLTCNKPDENKAITDNTYNGYEVKGRFLYTPDDEKVILIGPNLMSTWIDRPGNSFSEIAKTGANCVRICVVESDTPKEVDNWIQKCIDNKMIPMINNCEYVGKWPVRDVLSWYTDPEIVKVFKKHESYLLINIVDEGGNYETPTYDKFEEEYKYIISELRKAEIQVPLIIDGVEFGQNIEVFRKKGLALIQHDPEHRLMFNLTLYDEWIDEEKVEQEIKQTIDMGIPLLCGEWSMFRASDCGCCVAMDKILEVCNKYEIGQIPWSWGPGNQPCSDMDMTFDGTFEGLTNWGKNVAIEHQYSIKNTALIPGYIKNLEK